MDSSVTPDREILQDIDQFIPEKLNGVLFSGWYKDRIWIDDLSTYLDQIRIDPDELNMNKILKSVNRRIKKIRPGFNGIEKNSDQFSIFVDWSKDSKIIGHYWFMIESAYLGPKFVVFQLKILRPVSYKDSISTKKCPHCGKLPIEEDSSTEDSLNLSEIARNLQSKFQDIFTPTEWWTEAKPHLTFANLVKCGKFLIVLLLAGISGLGNFLMYMASHTNRFVFALSGFMKASTPFLLACVDTFNRIIAGFFTLIAMMWKDVRRPENPQETSNRLAYERNEARKKFLEGPNMPYRRDVNRPYL